jgi:aminopeptidase N
MFELGETIAHECSHNWFGDLATMKWFDDTWLKESFADFMAFTCMDQIKDKVTTIPHYLSGWFGGQQRAVEGYREDQMSTTHPVRSEVPNTELAKVYFDGITYRKGMMTLKQLFYIMGEDNFFRGVTDYFTRFAWGNGTVDDFLESITPYFSNPITEYTPQLWKYMWL